MISKDIKRPLSNSIKDDNVSKKGNAKNRKTRPTPEDNVWIDAKYPSKSSLKSILARPIE